ncbi:hypothetical protein K8O93_18725 [Gordonia bronchialis]|uniref:hypothetical protein n=1 Tax=Gordonia bronchialis TaxID=2054 RepID=UPI001CBB3642|nr:hypothetical protein [Gordonia bronchialis]UAK37181.1 hypothetical protein K8O93_18725 [Gordonia bronchialis]
MSDEFEYVDEHGNPIDPAELGDDVEIIEEVIEYDDETGGDVIDPGFEVDDEVPDAPLDGGSVVLDDPVPVGRVALDKEPVPVPEVIAAPEEASAPVTSMPSLSGRGKLALAGVGVAVVAVLGVVVFGLSALGNQNTAEDIKAAGESKYAQASSVVASKSSAVRSEVDSATSAVDTCRVGAEAATSATGTLADAVMTGSTRPRLELVIDATAPLPTTFVRAKAGAEAADAGQKKTRLARNAKRLDLIQLSTTAWAAYAYTAPDDAPAPAWRKADVTVSDGDITVTGDRDWPGGDAPTAGSCEHGAPGAYAVSGTVPAGAAGLVDGTATVDLIQGVAGEPTKAVALMGDSVALVTLAAPSDAEGGDASASSSSVPSK